MAYLKFNKDELVNLEYSLKREGILVLPMQSVTLSNSITEIPDGAFLSCSALTDIQLGDQITKIGRMATTTMPSPMSFIKPNGAAYIPRS